jgi:[NiFe] hydrogenase diaphorase moiety small subunit
MLFVEGNHFCPSCEKSGNCTLQATAYDLKMMSPHFDMFYPDRPVDASHPDVLLDFNRCILCSLCVRASATWTARTSSPWAGAASSARLHGQSTANPASWPTPTSPSPTAPPEVCPVGVILPKRKGFAVPIGERRYDKAPINEQVKEPLKEAAP